MSASLFSGVISAVAAAVISCVSVLGASEVLPVALACALWSLP
jgi:hypothetical protein